MTRRRIIAGVILLAAAVVAVPFAPGVWETVAYERDCQASIEWSDAAVRAAALADLRQGRMHSYAVYDGHRMVLSRKRYGWLPGKEFIVPDQVCPACTWNIHDECFHPPAKNHCSLADGTHVDIPADFRCTCTDPSHGGD